MSNPDSSTVHHHLNVGDPSPFGHDNSSFPTPPHDVIIAYGQRPYHAVTMRGDWQTGRAVDALSTHVIRSAQNLEKTHDREKWKHVVFRFEHDEFLHLHGRLLVSYAPTMEQAGRRLRDFSEKFLPAEGKITPTFNIINSSYGMLRAEQVEIKTDDIPRENVLDLLYGEDFPAWHENFVKTIIGKKSGLSLLEGPPGTGKTTYLRLLMIKLKKTHRFYYLPPSSLGCLVQSELVDFWIEEKQRYGGDKRFVVILEDSEAALMTRDADNRSQVSAILNITDGMFGDFLRTHIICTINCPSSCLDPALLRPGRLVGHRNFGRLPADHAARLAAHLGKELPPGDDHSLAEVFAGPSIREDAPRIIGFAA
jgi:hypothetical protein